jgi:hypothetical protein
MAQSVTWSWIESIVRTLVLFLLAQATFELAHILGWVRIDLGIGFEINLFLTFASLLVSYYVRRWFVRFEK